MSDVAYRAQIRIERVQGPVRRAHLPAEKDPVIFGVHGAIAEHYKVPADAFEPHATTIDYVIASTGGWLTGTFGGALEARKISAAGDRLLADVTGEVEKEEGVLVIRRIHVRFHLKALADQKETAERVHGMFADRCPLYRSLRGSIQMSTELEFESIPDNS